MSCKGSSDGRRKDAIDALILMYATEVSDG
jgi:hypothetical protein